MFKSRLAMLTALLAPCAFCVGTKSWVQSNQQDFEKGTLKNLSLRSDGQLVLAPVFREVHDPSIAYLWSLAQDSKGILYSGGGGPSATTAKLVAVDAAGKARTLAELPGLQIQSIAIDSKDRVFAATSPDGKVYRVEATGKHEVFYDPKAKYIWGLAFNSKGELFVATGDGGEIHRVTPDGKGSVFFKTEETHARSMAIDAKDNVIVGTEPGGLILRISPAGEGFVLYQTTKREVTAVAVSRDGQIFAAAVGNKALVPSSGPSGMIVPPPPAPAQTNPAAPAGRAIQPAAAPIPSAPPAVPSVSGGSDVFRISTDDYPQKIWSHPQDVVYAIGMDASGRPVVGTGNRGNIYRIDSERISTLLINASPTQVTAFSSGPKGRLYAATGNVGKIYQIGPESTKTGSYESDPLDGTFFSYWGRIRYKGEPEGGSIAFETRSGNLDRPQNNWSAWSPVDATKLRVTSPSARFMQYRVTLNSAPDGRSPEIREVEIAYMAKNVPPTLEEIDITPANYKFPAPSQSVSAAQTLSLPPLGQRPRPTSTLSLDSVTSNQSMQQAKGSLGARWAVSDPNGDELLFRVEIRGLEEKEWKLLRDRVKEKYISWESAAHPDGEYKLRVTASDAPSNPPDLALSSQLESERFIIDNTPPQITGFSGKREGTNLKITWRARDARSVVEKAEYSLNGGDWVVVQPTTRLSDSPEHEYVLSVPAAGAEPTVAIRVTDEFDNQAVEKVVVR